MIYEFRCHSCGRRFEVYATLKEKEAGLSPQCPRCGSGDVGRVFSPVLFLRRSEGGRSEEARPAAFDGGPDGSGIEDFDAGLGNGGDGGLWDEGGWDDDGWDGDDWDGDGRDGEDELADAGAGPGPTGFGDEDDGDDDPFGGFDGSDGGMDDRNPEADELDEERG